MITVGVCYDYGGPELYEIYQLLDTDTGEVWDPYPCLDDHEIEEFLKGCVLLRERCSYEEYLNCKVKLSMCCGG